MQEDYIDSEKQYFSQLTDEIFRAYVDAIIPRTPSLAGEYGRVQ